MTSRSRWRRRAFKAAFWLLLVGLLLYVFVLPAVVRMRVLAALRGIDRSAGFELRHVSPYRLQMANLELGAAPWLTADVVEVSYRPGRLLRGRVDTIRAEGVEWRIGIGDGAIDAGDVRHGREVGSGGLERLRRLELRHAAVVIDAGEQQLRVPFDVTLTARGEGAYDASARAAGIALASADHGVAIYNADLRLDAIVDRRLEPTALTGALRADRVELAGMSLTDAVITVEREAEGSLDWWLSAGGDGPVRQLALDGSLTLPADPADDAGWTGSADLAATVAVAGAALRGVAGRIDFDAALGTDGLDLRLRPGSQVSALALEGDAVGVTAGAAAPGRPPMMLSVNEPGGTAIARSNEAGLSWRASAPLHLRVRDADVALELPELGRTRLEQLGADLNVIVDADAKALRVALAGEGSLSVNALRREPGGLVVPDPVRVTLSALEARPLAVLSDGGTDLCGTARMRMDRPVSYLLPPMVGSVGGLELSGSACRRADGQPMLDATVIVTDASARRPAAELAVEAIDMRVPVTMNVERPDEGSFTLAGVRAGGRTLGSAAGRVAVHDGQLAATGHMQLPGGLPVDLHGRLERAGDQVVGRLRIEAPPGAIDDPRAFARLLGLGPKASVGGTWSLDADLALVGADLGGSARVACADASLTLPDQALTARGISGAVTFDRLVPPSTGGGERVTISTGRVGRVEFRDASIRFSVEGPGRLLIEQAGWVMGETARVSTDAFRVDFAQPVLETTLYVQRLGLRYWLPLLTDGRATGEGTLHGRLPIVYRPRAGQPITLGEGFLYAGPDRGWIATGEAQRLAALLDRSDARFQSDERMRTLKQQLIDALADYEFDILRFDLVPEQDGLTLRAFTSGRGRRGDQPQEIGGLTVNVRAFDVALSRLLSLQGALDHEADHALERFFND